MYLLIEKKILVELLHGIGDIVCAVPMLRALRNKFPLARIDVVVKFQTCADVLQCADVKLDNYYVLNVYSGVGSVYKFVKKCRKTGYDIGIAAPHTSVIKTKIFMRLIHPVQWFGIQKQGICFDTMLNECHFVETYFLAAKELLKEEVVVSAPVLIPPDLSQNDEQCLNSKTIDDIVGVCIGNADYSYKYRLLRMGRVYTRGWGIENMRELICKLMNSGISVVLFGGKQEELLLPELRDVLTSDKVINMVGKTSIAESMMLTKKCKCVVGVDTGMMHIAAAVGIPTVSIFGPTNPYTHGAYGDKAKFIYDVKYCEKSPCYGSKMYVKCTDRKCLKKISVNEVYNIISNVIN